MSTHELCIADTIPLRNSTARMPLLGFGVYRIPPCDCAAACLSALDSGYRLLDTAQLYKNEAEVGEALRGRIATSSSLSSSSSSSSSSPPSLPVAPSPPSPSSPKPEAPRVSRSEVFITTKIKTPGKTPLETYQKALDSMRKIAGEDENGEAAYIDLFLVHVPYGGKKQRMAMWLALEQLHAEGRARAIGVSNFTEEHLEEMRQYARVWPPHVNQILLHPWNQQRDLVEYCRRNGIVVQAYSPLAEGSRMQDRTLLEVTERHPGKSAAQVLLRYALQKGWVPLPKSARPERIQENADVFDFELSTEEMSALSALEA